MPFSFCKRCMDMRQFLPNGYDDLPRHCDVCGAEEVNNFVAQETERFGKAKGGSLDHFYDKIFEALETDEPEDIDKKISKLRDIDNKYGFGLIDLIRNEETGTPMPLFGSGTAYGEADVEAEEIDPSILADPMILDILHQIPIHDMIKDAGSVVSDFVKDKLGIEGLMGDLLSGDIIFTKKEREELERLRGEAWVEDDDEEDPRRLQYSQQFIDDLNNKGIVQLGDGENDKKI